MSKLPSGKVALVFDNKEQLIRCLDLVAQYDGLSCEVVPWRVIYGPALLEQLCRKKGIAPKRVIAVVPPEDLPPEEPEERERSFQMVNKLLQDAGVIPGHQ